MINQIEISSTDPDIDTFLKTVPEGTTVPGVFFNQNEEMFIRFPGTVVFPSFPVHHDIRNSEPSREYRHSLHAFIMEIASQVPGLFHGLHYYFDQSEILHPCFYQVFKVKEKYCLYLLRLDLSYRTHYGKIGKPGGNDFTPSYTSDSLFIESDLIPLNDILSTNTRFTGFLVDQIVSRNWIGETGRGYTVQGIWIDHELTKLFTHLFLDSGIRSYPYYPFSCKYRTLCHSLMNPGIEGRKAGVPLLYRALETVRPWMDTIQNMLKATAFFPGQKQFLSLKNSVPAYWSSQWHSLHSRAYLNSDQMKEYSVEF